MIEETARKICVLNARTYSRIARQFSDTRARSWDDFDPLVRYVKDGMSILDIGCGNGRLLMAFLKDARISYVGVDVSTELIHEAQKKHQIMKKSKNVILSETKDLMMSSLGSSPRAGLGLARGSRIHGFQIKSGMTALDQSPQFFSGDILSLCDIPGIQGRQFDVVSAIAVLNHIPSRKLQSQALFQMRDFLKPGGMLFLTNWNLLQIGVRKNVWRYAWERFRMPDIVWQGKYGFSKKEFCIRDCMTTWKSCQLAEPLYYYSFTLSELARLCRAAGFRLEDVYYSKKGKCAHWWDGRNSVVIARKV